MRGLESGLNHLYELNNQVRDYLLQFVTLVNLAHRLQALIESDTVGRAR